MNTSWNWAKFGLVLLALPLVATAAASAHLQIAKSSAITVGSEVVAAPAMTVAMDRVHTVALNGNGGIDGRIVTLQESGAQGLADSNVRFIKDGQTVGQATTDSDGVFNALSIPEGIYSFVASSENGFVTYSVRVISDTTGTYDDVMEAVAVPNVNEVLTLVETDSAADANPTTETNKDRMDENGANRVVLKNGILKGQIFATTTGLVGQTKVHILKNGQLVKSVITDENGAYEISGMEEGVFALVAVGPTGKAVVGFEAIDFTDQVNNASDVVYVSTQEPAATPASDALNVYTANAVTPSVEPAFQEPVYDGGGSLPVEYAGEEFAYGCAGGSCGEAAPSYATPCGGGCGGGGAGGGVGGMGRLLGIAGLSLGIVALADNSNPAPATPVTP